MTRLGQAIRNPDNWMSAFWFCIACAAIAALVFGILYMQDRGRNKDGKRALVRASISPAVCVPFSAGATACQALPHNATSMTLVNMSSILEDSHNWVNLTLNAIDIAANSLYEVAGFVEVGYNVTLLGVGIPSMDVIVTRGGVQFGLCRDFGIIPANLTSSLDASARNYGVSCSSVVNLQAGDRLQLFAQWVNSDATNGAEINGIIDNVPAVNGTQTTTQLSLVQL